MKNVELAYMHYTKIADYLKKKNALIIPFGTVEAHGKHLPVNTDTLIASELARRCAEKLDILVAPPLEYGITNSLFRYPAASFINPETYKAFVKDMLQSFTGHGFKRLVLMNGHGGHNQILNECVTDFAKIPHQRAVAIHWWIAADDILKETYGPDGHAAGAETGLINAIDEALVAQDLYSTDTHYTAADGIFVHPTPGPVIYQQKSEGPLDFNREKDLSFRDKIVSFLTERLRIVFSGWDDLDRYEQD